MTCKWRSKRKKLSQNKISALMYSYFIFPLLLNPIGKNQLNLKIFYWKRLNLTKQESLFLEDLTITYMYLFSGFFYNIGPIFKKLHPRWSKESDRVIRPKPDYRIILWQLQLFAFLFIQSSGFSLRTQLVKKGW